jgi:hypothetical protein
MPSPAIPPPPLALADVRKKNLALIRRFGGRRLEMPINFGSPRSEMPHWDLALDPTGNIVGISSPHGKFNAEHFLSRDCAVVPVLMTPEKGIAWYSSNFHGTEAQKAAMKALFDDTGAERKSHLAHSPLRLDIAFDENPSLGVTGHHGEVARKFVSEGVHWISDSQKRSQELGLNIYQDSTGSLRVAGSSEQFVGTLKISMKWKKNKPVFKCKWVGTANLTRSEMKKLSEGLPRLFLIPKARSQKGFWKWLSGSKP